MEQPRQPLSCETNAKHNREWNLLASVAGGVLVFGVLAFVYSVFSEVYISQRLGDPQRPYGQTAMLSVAVSAFLGGLGATAVFELLHDCRRLVLSAYALVVGAIATWYGTAWQAWNATAWDSSNYIIFPSVVFALGVNVCILVCGICRCFFSKHGGNRGRRASDHP